MSFTDSVKNFPRLPNGGSDPIGFLTTIADPSRSFRMTINVLYKDHIIKEYLAISCQLTADSFYLLTAFFITTANPSHSLRMTPCHERRFHQQMKKLSKIRLSPSDSFFLSHNSLPVPAFRIASSLHRICFSSVSPKKRPTGSPLSLKPCMVTSVPV